MKFFTFSVGLLAVHYTYDDQGFLTQTRQGDRITVFTYNAQGRLETITDPLSRTTTLAYDSVGRVLKQTLADGRIIDYGYDANGNLTVLTPPGRPAHLFDHTPVNLTRMYLPRSFQTAQAIPFTSTTWTDNLPEPSFIGYDIHF